MIKNPSKIDPQRAPETLLEQRSLLEPLICAFLALFGTPMGPQNRSKINHFVDLFFNDFWEPLFHAFGLRLGSQNDPKKRPKREPRTERENHRFCNYVLYLSHIEGSKKSSFWVLFGTLFKIPFRDHFFIDFGSFWGPFWDPLGT